MIQHKQVLYANLSNSEIRYKNVYVPDRGVYTYVYVYVLFVYATMM